MDDLRDFYRRLMAAAERERMRPFRPAPMIVMPGSRMSMSLDGYLTDPKPAGPGVVGWDVHSEIERVTP
jgi:hypothetical protein